MTATCREIELLILRVQNASLETPGLALTPPAARCTLARHWRTVTMKGTA